MNSALLLIIFMHYPHNFPALDGPQRRLAVAWLVLAVASLAASSLFALLLVISRTPYLGRILPGDDFFQMALVLHVNLSSLIWFLAFAGAMWSLRTGSRWASLSWLAFWIAAVGASIVTLSPFAGTGAPLMNNYVPILNHPIFLTGLALFGGGVALMAVRILFTVNPVRPSDPWTIGLYGAAVAVAFGFVSLGWSFATVPSLPAGAYFESVFWGLGHSLQFAHTLMMLVVWLILADRLGARVRLGPRTLAALLVLVIAPLLAVPVIHASHAATTEEFRQGFTALMSWGTWPAALPVGVALLFALAKNRSPDNEMRPLRMALLLSLTLFASGLVIGSLIRHDNAMVPAHYHGVIGAVTLAYMGLGLHLLPQLGFAKPLSRLARWQPVCYGGGTLLMVLGLAWSGGHGVARKLPGSAQILDGFQEVLGMVLMGVGGVVAVTGSLMFLLLVYRAMGPVRWRAAPDSDAVPMGSAGERLAARRIDRRPLAISLTVSMIIAVGMIVSLIPSSGFRQTNLKAVRIDPKLDPTEHARQAKATEIAQRFQQAVAMLHVKQYEHAATALHRVLELDPTLVEAHVNMGYAMIGLERYKVALDFFESATQLRPMQANAYYGMAIALEGMNDIPGAIGAMRAYIHLSRSDDPFVPKARSALWEWESRRAGASGGKAKSLSPRLPENGK